jgi:hypothetical protein
VPDEIPFMPLSPGVFRVPPIAPPSSLAAGGNQSAASELGGAMFGSGCHPAFFQAARIMR